MGGREFFEACREVNACVPRNPNRRVLRIPVIVTPEDRNSAKRLLFIENVSPGGVFLNDRQLVHGVSDTLQLNLPGHSDIQTRVEVRWVREKKGPAQPIGYGCAFLDTEGRAVSKLLEMAQFSPLVRQSLAVPRK